MDNDTPGDTERRRTGRRPGQSGSRHDILNAARHLFAEQGYESTSLRAISREAGVDPALVHHFFDGKAAVFDAAFADVVKPREIFDEEFGGDVPDVGERLVGRFLSIWEQQETRGALMAMLRSSVAHADAAELLSEFMTDGPLRQIAENAAPEDAEMRAALVSSQLIGVALLRYVMRTEPLASADAEQIARRIGPTIERYVFEDLAASDHAAADDWVVPGHPRRADRPVEPDDGPSPALPPRPAAGRPR
jgi:AcrR family transcriptional regulator